MHIPAYASPVILYKKIEEYGNYGVHKKPIYSIEFSKKELNNLIKEKVDYLFIALPHEGNNESADLNKFPIEDEWAVSHPEYFNLVFSNCQARIYKFLSQH